MKKLTFVVSYAGGTYIAQHFAQDLRAGIGLWLEHLDSEYEYFNREIHEKLKDILKYEEYFPVPLEGVDNTWRTSIMILDKLFLLNIVETVPTPTIPEKKRDIRYEKNEDVKRGFLKGRKRQ